MTGQYLGLRSAGQVARAQLTELKENEFWNSSADGELKLHRIHAYPAKFPAFIPTKALEFARSQGHRVKRVADIFCGCGTVGFEARRSAIDFWGCDINPVATLIAKTKSGSFDSTRLKSYYTEIVGAVPHASEQLDLSETAVTRLRYWYSKKQLRNLAKLLNTINEAVPTRSRYRIFFHCAFSNILKSTSTWLTKSIKPQVDPHKVPAPVMTAFAKQFESKRQTNPTVDKRGGSGYWFRAAQAVGVRSASF